MKKIVSLIVLLCGAALMYSQEQDTIVLRDIERAYNAYIMLRDAAAAEDVEVLGRVAGKIDCLSIEPFDSLMVQDGAAQSLQGHLVFNAQFARNLSWGENAYQNADSLSADDNRRGEYADGKIRSKTCFIQAGGSRKYTFSSSGYQEIAIVAEQGGMVTMKIHVTNSKGLNVRYDDQDDVKKGRPQRKRTFTLPTDCTSIVELEIINYGNDCTIVVINN